MSRSGHVAAPTLPVSDTTPDSLGASDTMAVLSSLLSPVVEAIARVEKKIRQLADERLVRVDNTYFPDCGGSFKNARECFEFLATLTDAEVQLLDEGKLRIVDAPREWYLRLVSEDREPVADGKKSKKEVGNRPWTPSRENEHDGFEGSGREYEETRHSTRAYNLGPMSSPASLSKPYTDVPRPGYGIFNTPIINTGSGTKLCRNSRDGTWRNIKLLKYETHEHTERAILLGMPSTEFWMGEEEEEEWSDTDSSVTDEEAELLGRECD